jgi:hypothetical protein
VENELDLTKKQLDRVTSGRKAKTLFTSLNLDMIQNSPTKSSVFGNSAKNRESRVVQFLKEVKEYETIIE